MTRAAGMFCALGAVAVGDSALASAAAVIPLSFTLAWPGAVKSRSSPMVRPTQGRVKALALKSGKAGRSIRTSSPEMDGIAVLISHHPGFHEDARLFKSASPRQ